MNKRRRTPSIASRSVDDDESDSQSVGVIETSRKKRKLDPLDLMQNLYDTVRSFKKDDGSLLCDAFIRVPKRRQEPGYHDVVHNPIDLLKIQQKLKTDEYDDVDDMQQDVELLVNNAKTFYKRTSQEYKDANELWELFLQTKARIFDTCDEVVNENKAKIILKARRVTPNSSSPDVKKQESLELEESSTDSWATTNEDELNLCEELFSTVMTASDQDTRPLYPVFQLLPSKKLYPEYYDVIENPIDLRTIARKIQDGKYANLNEMERDLLLMTKNACLFNEPGSQIYKDAKTLKKIISSRKIEIEHGKSTLEKKSERISYSFRNKRLRGPSQSLSAITAALKSEDEDSDLEEEAGDDSIDEEPDNPRWQLYNAVRTSTNAQGVSLADPFLKLPSKRYYPNYYKEIKNPLSLLQIKKKLINGEYGTVSEVAGDLNILFENAKKFNKPDSKLYKDAVKLQKDMQNKVQELLDFQNQYSDSEDDSADEPTAKRVKSSKALTRGKYLNNIPLKRRLYSLCKCIKDYVTEDGRQPMLMFMEKPSKKLYPDYYKVISEPIDMLTIENNIRSEKYNSEEEILNDFKLMFRNCREYNEEGSLIYEDAIMLEKILMDHVKDLGPIERKTPAKIVSQIPSPTVIKSKKLPLPPTPTMMKMRTLFSTIKDYKDSKGRQLSVIFNKLPSKIEYPDYYEVIKKPINLEIISQKLKGNCYESLDDLVSDFVLMFDNACKYNEPDSQIYKDALTLQKVTLQTKLQLREDEDTVPDVPSAVQELLTSLFTTVYNHQDEEGRCFSDSMAELPEHDEVDGKKIRAISLDLIKRRLDSGQYRRLDMFQDDMFICFERARRLSRTDSQVFEDSIELQSFFIRQRDEICRNGDLLNSPALNYTLFDLSAAVSTMRDSKSAEEQIDGSNKEDENDVTAQEDSIKEEEDDDGSSVIQSTGNSVGAVDNAMSYNQQVYRIGDFVYAEPKERGMEPMLFNIQRLWIAQDNQQMMYGNQYYRPSETYHVTTRKFLEKEVFKTDQHMALPLSSIKGRCAVLSVKDYFRAKPEGFDDKDVYVCESRYSSKARCFKKIKNWPLSLTNVCKLIDREEPLEPKRNVSVYRDRVEKHKEEIAELEEQEKLVEKEKPNVVVTHLPQNADEGCTYYEQYNAPQCLIKTGDCVYIRNDTKNNTSRTLICQINKIWTNKTGDALIHGPWLVLPADVPHPPNKLFYKQEILLSTLENTNEVSQIVGKCAVLEHSEYISCRPTEIPETEVYICESMFDEARQQIVELPKDGLKKFVHSSAVYQDEIYFFRRLINPTKVNSVGDAEQTTVAPEKTNVQSEQPFQSCNATMVKVEPPDVCEDSMDGGPPSVCSSDMGAPSTPNSNSNFIVTTHTGKKKRGNSEKSKQVTGYILYSSEMRKTFTQSNPAHTFGEVSRIVGNAWKKLPIHEKNEWEEKAIRINAETLAKIERGELTPSSAMSALHASFIGPTLPDHVWECLWDNCDYMFEDQLDCLEHAVADGSGHVASTFAGTHTTEFQCQWKNCPRIKKQAPPFPSLHRLIRHVKEVHILKSIGRVVPPNDRSKNVITCSRIPPTISIPSAAPSPPAATTNANDNPTAATPVTVTATQANREIPSPQVQPVVNGVSNPPAAKPRSNEPLFVVVPPKPHRVLHSDIYLKYIENLSVDKPAQVGNWEKQLYAAPENVPPPDSNKLPAAWLGNGIGNHGNIMNALWALREYMLEDALNIKKTV
ncbi:protein polybromo-1 isoform X3 [Planococcus citri]|uniref:protein polybromo-1 isoform X3 n=1 Tax=Planococcus citri TaxID=170843 RepID=UPI0031F77029